MRLLGDEDVARLSARDAVTAMRAALVAHTRGEYLSPPRLSAKVGDARVIFGAGGVGDGSIALRVSGPAASRLEHLTVTWSPSGELEAIIVGNAIASRRTGAVAAVAIDALAPPGDVRVGIVGSGRNGWAQIWGLMGARHIVELAIFSPTAENREAFAERARLELRLDARSVGSSQEAVEDMDVVVLCTTSHEPVIDAGWVRDGAVVSSIGAKSVTAHQVPTDLLDRMSYVVSDAPEEISSPLSELAGLPLVALGALLTGERVLASPASVALFLYAGLGAEDSAYARAVGMLA